MCGSKFFEVLRQVDEVLGSGPSDENSLRLLGLLRDPATEQYCFDRLDNPNWISPLRSRGFFTKPPSLVRDVSKGTFAFPPWPQSRYLARVAKGSPALVLEVILGIPETDNEIVHVDLVEATLGMPAELAAEWAKTEIAWIERREALYMLLPVKLGALISHLAKGGQGRVALDLARILLAVLPDPRAFEREREFGEKMPELSLPQPRPRFDLWEYGQVLEKNIPDLVAATGEKALWMLCELLRTAVELSRSGKDDKGPYDYSYIWRPEIDRGRSTDDDLKSMLVSAVRDATEEQVRVNPAAIAELAEGLEERGQRWLVFSRLALHVLRMFPAGVADMIEDRLSKPEKYDDPHFHREYRLLLKEHFGKMKSENQERIYAWIEMGPTRKMAEQCKFLGRTATEADITRLSNRWRLERLLPIESYLTGQWKSLYEALVKQLGEPENKDFVQHRISSWSGPTSPKTAQELSQMSFEEIVAFLRQWEPSGEWSASTREGLSRDLTTAVAANPERFAAEAERFRDLDPTYVRGFIFGLTQAGREDRKFSSWGPILNLCQWAVEQPREISGRQEANLANDPHWGWARADVARLLSVGFEGKAAELPVDYRKLAWSVLIPLTQDPSPTREEETRHGGSSMDPATMSINTTRGEAMHAVVRYGLWVRRHFEKEADAKQRLARGFDEMPEVREVLDYHLDIAKDPSLAIRSVYGQWFPWLVLLDARWARDNVPRIFQPDDGACDAWSAAWEAYVTFSDAYDQVLDLLGEEYRRAIERMETSTKAASHLADPNGRLAQHLMVFYWRGKLRLHDRGNLLDRFYERAGDALRGAAIDFVGRSLGPPDKVPEAILGRLRQLWEWRLEAALAAQPAESHATELIAFGWWLVSAKFEDAWAMNQLLTTLRLVPRTDPAHQVVKRLAELSSKMPREAVECLKLIIEGDIEGWAVSIWREHARALLENALRCSDPEARAAAEDVVHQLGARGYFEFRDLLRAKLS